VPPVLRTRINFEEFFVDGNQSIKLMSCFHKLNRILLPHCGMKVDDYNDDDDNSDNEDNHDDDDGGGGGDDDDDDDDDDDGSGDGVGKLYGDTEQSG
jgi:hypothetical protein